MTKHHPIENLAHAVSCNSGAMTKEGHEHLLEAAKEVVEWWVEVTKALAKTGIE